MSQSHTFEIRDDDTVLVNGVEYKRAKPEEPSKPSRLLDIIDKHFFLHDRGKELVCAAVDDWLKERMPNGTYTGDFWIGYKSAIIQLRRYVK